MSVIRILSVLASGKEIELISEKLGCERLHMVADYREGRSAQDGAALRGVKW